MAQDAIYLAALAIIALVAWRVETRTSRELGVLLRTYLYAAVLASAAFLLQLIGFALLIDGAVEDAAVFAGALVMGVAILVGALLALRGWGPGLVLAIIVHLGGFAYQASIVGFSLEDSLWLLIPVAILIRSWKKLQWGLSPGLTRASTRRAHRVA